MSKIFYDKLLDLGIVEKRINQIAKSPEEKQELWQIVDETIHHRITGCILETLPRQHHQEFLTLMHNRPHDENILEFLKEKARVDIIEFIKKEAIALGYELLDELSLRVNTTSKTK